MRHLKAYLPAISVFCLALSVRIVYNVTVAGGYTPIFDAAIYNNLARSILYEHCYCYYAHNPTAFRPPLWPFIIATIYFFAGEHSDYVRLFCCLLGSGTCVLVYFFAKDLFGKRVALITGVIAAIYTGLFIWDGWLYTESLYTFCLTAFTFSLYQLQHSTLPAWLTARSRPPTIFLPWRRWIIFSGIFLGLAVLARPTGSILVGLLCLWAVLVIFAKVMPWQAAISSALIIVLIAAVINVPWLYRNYRVTHAFIPVSTLGTTLAGTFNDQVAYGKPGLRGLWNLPANLVNPDFNSYTFVNERADTEQAFNWMRTHLSTMPYLFSLHFRDMWTPYMYSHGLPFEEFPGQLSSKIILLMIPIMSIPIFLLAALGLAVTWRRRKKQLLVVYIIIALTIVQNMAFYGLPRYRAPIEPFLALMVGGALWWVICDEPGTLLHFRFWKRIVQEDSKSIPV